MLEVAGRKRSRRKRVIPDNHIIAAVEEGLTPSEMATRFRVSIGVIMKRLSALKRSGLISDWRRKRNYQVWTHEETEKLVSMIEGGASIDQVAKALGRSPGAVRKRAEAIGLKVIGKLDPKRDRTILEWYLEGEPPTRIAERFGMTRMEVIYVLRHYGFSGAKVSIETRVKRMSELGFDAETVANAFALTVDRVVEIILASGESHYMGEAELKEVISRAYELAGPAVALGLVETHRAWRQANGMEAVL